MSIFVSKFFSLGNANNVEPVAVIDPLEQDRLEAVRKFQVPEEQWPKHMAIQRMLKAAISFDHPILFGVDFSAGGFQDQSPRSINEGTTDLGSPYAVKAAWVPRGWTLWFARKEKNGNFTWHTIGHQGPKFVTEAEIFHELNTKKAKSYVYQLNQVAIAADNRDASVKTTQEEGALLAEIARQNELKAAASKKLAEQQKSIEQTNVAQILKDVAVERAERSAATEEVTALANQQTQAKLMLQGQLLSSQIQAAQTTAQVKRFLPIALAGGAAIAVALLLKGMRR